MLQHVCDVLPRDFSSGQARYRVPSNDPLMVLELAKKWRDIVGTQLAGKCIPLRVQGNKLIIGVAHMAYAQQFQLLQDDLLNLIAKHIRSNRIKCLKFVQSDLSLDQLSISTPTQDRKSPKVLTNQELILHQRAAREFESQDSELDQVFRELLVQRKLHDLGEKA